MAGKISQDWDEFVKEATRVASEQQYPVSVLLSQAAIETGRRTPPGYNYFGIKGPGQTLQTSEYGSEGYYKTPASFRTYQNPEQSIKDYMSLIMRKYPQAWNLRSNPEAMARAIAQGGYATDPSYAQKIVSTPEFRQYSNQPSAQAPQPSQQKTSFFSLVPQAYASSGQPAAVPMPRKLPSSPMPTYTVRKGDTLWDISQKLLGSGARYKELGYTGDAKKLPVGTKLKVPKKK